MVSSLKTVSTARLSVVTTVFFVIQDDFAVGKNECLGVFLSSCTLSPNSASVRRSSDAGAAILRPVAHVSHFACFIRWLRRRASFYRIAGERITKRDYLRERNWMLN